MLTNIISFNSLRDHVSRFSLCSSISHPTVKSEVFSAAPDSTTIEITAVSCLCAVFHRFRCILIIGFSNGRDLLFSSTIFLNLTLLHRCRSTLKITLFDRHGDRFSISFLIRYDTSLHRCRSILINTQFNDRREMRLR